MKSGNFSSPELVIKREIQRKWRCDVLRYNELNKQISGLSKKTSLMLIVQKPGQFLSFVINTTINQLFVPSAIVIRNPEITL